MGSSDDWFRKTTWSVQDAEDFERRLARSRGQRTQNIKIQAQCLAETRRPELADPAIALAQRYLQEEPQGFFEVQAHLVIAEAKRTKGDVAGALQAYRAAVQAESRHRGVSSFAYLELAWFVATRDLREAFDEALTALESAGEDDLLFPIIQYQYFGALALMSAATKDRDHARRTARNALEAATKAGPFSRHKTFGIVTGIEDDIQERIRRLAD